MNYTFIIDMFKSFGFLKIVDNTDLVSQSIISYSLVVLALTKLSIFSFINILIYFIIIIISYNDKLLQNLDK